VLDLVLFVYFDGVVVEFGGQFVYYLFDGECCFGMFGFVVGVGLGFVGEYVGVGELVGVEVVDVVEHECVEDWYV